MKELIITYIIIVILQLVYSIYVPVTSLNINNYFITDPVKEIEIKKFIEMKLDKIMEKANKMDYFEWINYVKKNSVYEYNGLKLYIFAWSNISDKKMILVNYPDDKLVGLSWSDFLKEHNEIILNSKYNNLN